MYVIKFQNQFFIGHYTSLMTEPLTISIKILRSITSISNSSLYKHSPLEKQFICVLLDLMSSCIKLFYHNYTGN